jgi:phage-related protein
MLGTVISNLTAKVTSFLDLCRVVVLTLKKLCSNIIAVGIDRMTLIAQYIKSQYVALKSSIKPCHAQLTNQVLLIKVGLMNVLHSLGQVGQQLLTTVRQILQRVLNLLKRGN